MKKRISYGRQFLDKSDIKSVIKVLKSDFLTQGPQVPIFENKVADLTGATYAVAFSTGTAALHAACYVAGITEGDEVITTPMTFAASANCVLYCGAIPIFADVKKNLPLIDPKAILRKINKRTKAIITVDYSGIPVDYSEIQATAQQNKLVLIADAAHALGATYKNRTVGMLADMTVFSFHPVKLVTTGEGGMVVTDQKKFYEKLLLFRNHGITKNPNLLARYDGPWYYEMQVLGYNYRLTDILAALGISQLKKFRGFLRKRSEIASMYQKAFRGFDLADILLVPSDRTSAWHLFPLLLKLEKLRVTKKTIVEELHKKNIFVQIHYIPIHLHPYYKKQFGYKKGDYPESEQFYEREISLPLHPMLSGKDISYVVQTVKEVLLSYAKE